MSLAEFRSPDIPEEFGPQESYVNKILGQERGPVIDTIAKSLGPMARQCRLSVCIPAYRESGVLERTLTEYTLRQVMPDGQPVDPESFEVNLLLNRPNASDPRDEGMVRIIEDFRARHPQYHVNVAEITYDFAGRAPIGRIFADIADAVVLRNTERPVSEQARSRLILRTAGADVEALNPLLISRTLSVFEDHSVVAHRGESRLPPELLREFPLLHVMQTFSIYAKRRLRGRLTMNGPFSYTADAYVRAGGFDTTLTVWEETDLSGKIATDVAASGGTMRMEADLVKDVLNNPRRQVANLLGGTSMAARYNNFGNPEQEAKVRASEDSWQDIKTGILPGHCQLTAENLSRELSAYYRTYLTWIPSWNKIDSHEAYSLVEKTFEYAFRVCGITDYTFHRSDIRARNIVEIRDIAPLLTLMDCRSFDWAKVFERPDTTVKPKTPANDRYSG